MQAEIDSADIVHNMKGDWEAKPTIKWKLKDLSEIIHHAP